MFRVWCKRISAAIFCLSIMYCYDIMNIYGVKEGEDVGRILNEVLDAVISGDLENERPTILKYLIEAHKTNL